VPEPAAFQAARGRCGARGRGRGAQGGSRKGNTRKRKADALTPLADLDAHPPGGAPPRHHSNPQPASAGGKDAADAPAYKRSTRPPRQQADDAAPGTAAKSAARGGKAPRGKKRAGKLQRELQEAKDDASRGVLEVGLYADLKRHENEQRSAGVFQGATNARKVSAYAMPGVEVEQL